MSKNNREFIRKTFPAIVLKVDAEQGTVEAVVNVFGNVDDGDDRVWKGAFIKTIAENFDRFQVLDNHNTDSILNAIGKPLEVRELSRNELPAEVLTKAPDATGGLYTRTQFMLDDPTSAAAFRRIRDGVIKEYSIGFNIMESGYSKVKTADGKEKTIRDIKQIRLWEYSPVLWGMNPATATADVKNNQEEDSVPTENKEYTPEGPQRRLGDYIKAGVHGKLMGCINILYGDGYMSDTEYMTLCDTGMEMMRQLDAAMSPDMAMRPMVSMDYLYWGSDPVNAEKTQAFLHTLRIAAESGQLVLKEGRMLSAANAAKIVSAVDSLVAVLTAAGVYDSVEDESEDEPPKAEAGPDIVPPTHAGAEQLRKQLMLLELQAMEVQSHAESSPGSGRASTPRPVPQVP